MKTETKTEHQRRREELERLSREILELEATKEVVKKIGPPPEHSLFATVALRADIQELLIQAAFELWKLIWDYTRNGHKISYRNFLVAAAGFGVICNNGRSKWFVKVAYNTKPHKNQEKKCAEMRIEKAMKAKRAKILILVVMAPPQEGDGTSALHPCPECRALMRGKYRSLYFPYSRVVLIHPTAVPGREGYTIGELMRFHEEADPWAE